MMKMQFGYANTHIVEKYRGKDDLHEHSACWTKAWGEELKLEWVHIFCHTLDTITMNWYLETELRHRTCYHSDFPKSFKKGKEV